MPHEAKMQNCILDAGIMQAGNVSAYRLSTPQNAGAFRRTATAPTSRQQIPNSHLYFAKSRVIVAKVDGVYSMSERRCIPGI